MIFGRRRGRGQGVSADNEHNPFEVGGGEERLKW